MSLCRSTPELGLGCLTKNSQLRKTHSQPQPQKSPGQKPSKSKSKESPKHSRTKSVPNDSKDKCTDGKHCPASPSGKSASLEKSKSDSKRSGSPKPKKTIFEGFRNTLRSKGKSDTSRTTSVSGASQNESPLVENDCGKASSHGASSTGGSVGKKAKKQGSSDSSEPDQPSPVRRNSLGHWSSR